MRCIVMLLLYIFSEGLNDWSWRVRFGAIQALVKVVNCLQGDKSKEGLRTTAWNALLRVNTMEKDSRVLEALQVGQVKCQNWKIQYLLLILLVLLQAFLILTNLPRILARTVYKLPFTIITVRRKFVSKCLCVEVHSVCCTQKTTNKVTVNHGRNKHQQTNDTW